MLAILQITYKNDAVVKKKKKKTAMITDKKRLVKKLVPQDSLLPQCKQIANFSGTCSVEGKILTKSAFS